MTPSQRDLYIASSAVVEQTYDSKYMVLESLEVHIVAKVLSFDNFKITQMYYLIYRKLLTYIVDIDFYI